MKLPFSRPSLEPFRRFEQRRSETGPVTARFLGTTSILFEDGETAILSDGFVTRPPLARVAVGRIAPDTARVENTLKQLGVESIAAVFTGHSHYDHALDAPEFARRTRADLVGSASTANIGFGLGLDSTQMRVVGDGDVLHYGRFELTFVESRHGRRERARGTVDAPIVPPAHARRWRTGTTYSVFIRHDRGTILVHGSAGYKPGALRGRRADVIYLGVAGLGKQTDAYARAYWDEVVRATGARSIILVHWDDFWRSLDKPLRAMPYPFDSVADGISKVVDLAAKHGLKVFMPVAWEPTDPFEGLG